MTPHGIPTVYNGVQYRSRLEARWAAFFDLLGWKYQYEPFELPGWIPDFLLLGPRPVLVEVKPVTEFPEDIAQEIISARPPRTEVLIVGCILPVLSLNDYRRKRQAGLDRWGNPEDECVLGWLYESEHEINVDLSDGVAVDFGWGDALFGRWSKGFAYGFNHDEGSFHDRISGAHDGDNTGSHSSLTREVLDLWTRAGNLTQWKGKQSVTT